MDAVERAVVAGVHDGEHVFRRHHRDEAAQEARGADAARERDDAQARYCESSCARSLCRLRSSASRFGSRSATSRNDES